MLLCKGKNLLVYIPILALFFPVGSLRDSHESTLSLCTDC